MATDSTAASISALSVIPRTPAAWAYVMPFSSAPARSWSRTAGLARTRRRRLALAETSRRAPAPPTAEVYKTHLAYVKERRSDSEGDAILEERLGELRDRGLIQ